jgi:epoxyqueuosine reductase
VLQQLALRKAIEGEAQRLGFQSFGIAAPDAIRTSAPLHMEWLRRGYGADMHYLYRDPPARYDPCSLLPECRSVIAVALGYYWPDQAWPKPGVAKVSRYTWGDDYHKVLKKKLHALGEWIDTQAPAHRWKATVDTSAINEKAFAAAAGIGWQGRNSLVLNRELGSYFFIGLLLSSLDLEPNTPAADGCGTCTICIQACPTGALTGPGVLKANLCISYHTTDSKQPPAAGTQLNNWLYGCDTCQQVCPYNADIPQSHEPRFAPRAGIRDITVHDVLEMDDAQFSERFAGTAIHRRKLWRLREQALRIVEAEASEA